MHVGQSQLAPRGLYQSSCLGLNKQIQLEHPKLIHPCFGLQEGALGHTDVHFLYSNPCCALKHNSTLNVV